MSPDLFSPTNEFVPATQEELSRYVVDNVAGARHALYPVGGRTGLSYGYPLRPGGVTVSTSKLIGVIDYPARDMTITVRAGIRIDELAAILKAEGQRLPVDVAQSYRATLGGVTATNPSGPRRFGYGTLRNYVIGIRAVDGHGRLFTAGSRVVKNVAGYDLCKLLVGSMGTLAVITQVTLKLWPLPETNALVWMTVDSLEAVDGLLDRLSASRTRPVAIEFLDPSAGGQIAAETRADLPHGRPILCVGFEGTERETDWQIETLKQECSAFDPRELVVLKGAAALPLWKGLTEFQTASDEPLTFRASLLPSKTIAFVKQAMDMGVALQAHAGNGIVVGHLPDHAVTAEGVRRILEPLRKSACDGRGSLVVVHCDDAWKTDVPVFGDPKPSWSLMKRLKTQLDPHDILNPGRFIDGPTMLS